MYLIDTNVISEARKGTKANPGVRAFFAQTREQVVPAYLSVVTMGELRSSVEILRHRSDHAQAGMLETWLTDLLAQFADQILTMDSDIAQVWGRLRVPQPEHTLDKQIAATALIHDLTVVTRNERDFAATGVSVLNPFSS